MRTAKTRLVPFLAACLLAAAAQAEESPSHPRPFLHHPAVSDGGARVAFCWQGDIWSCTCEGKDLKRLTDHPGYDTAPFYSPTSPQIAFSSDREGGMDVYVMPAAGGPPRRLTFHSADDTVLGFTPFGNAVIFASRRDTQRHRIYTVPLKGGEPSVLLEVGASQAAFSPDGTRVAFALGAMAWWRRGYRGAGNLDLWIKPLGERARKLTDWAGNDHQVLWGRDGKLWFVSDRPDRGGEDDPARVANLWVMNPDDPSDVRKVTSHARHPVVQPSVSPDGNWIVYLNLEGGLHLLDCSSREVSVVPVQPSADLKEDPVSRRWGPYLYC